ncbi:MAG: pyridoxamine 5'-phosphate oxidase family protein [Synergistaceae bacterium]|nr:pyridoxamine 5'-phosphate oxidase family protein [Synergistaceae bacterium]
MKKIIDLLHEAGVFHFATVDGDRARVRPFGFVMEFEEKLYFTTGNQKPVYRQLKKNPHAEICGTLPDRKWIRIEGRAVFDGSMPAKKNAFKLYPNFKNLYETPENPAFEVFYLENASAVLYSMETAPEKIL